MIDALARWLQQIIAVVLLASLADLLLPNRVMQRYVRLVAGLFILLTLITPLLQWTRGDFDTKLAAGIESALRSPQSDEDELNRIREDGERLQAVWTGRAENLAAERLAAEIRNEVEQAEGVNVRRVEVNVGKSAQGERQVESVTVVLAAASEQASAGGRRSRAIADVEPVAPVNVDIGVPAPSGSSESGGIGAEAGEQPAADRQTQLRIATLVASRFGLAADHVSVVRETDPKDGNSG